MTAMRNTSTFPQWEEKTTNNVTSFHKDLNISLNLEIKHIPFSNSGKTLAVASMCNQKEIGIKFEFTTPNTLQQKRRMEQKFTLLYGYMRARLAESGIDGPLNFNLWCKASDT